LLLFSGFQTINRIKQAKYNYSSGKYSVEQSTYDLALNVASTYLQVLFATERLEISLKLLANSEMQVTRLKKLESAGTITKADLLNVEALMATEEVNLVQAENQLEIAKLNLIQLMNLRENDIRIEQPQTPQTIDDYTANISAEDVFVSALGNQPNIKAAELRAMSANTGIGIAKGAFYPSISLTGSIGSGYSSIRKELDSGSVVITPKPPILYPTIGGDFVVIPQNPDVNFKLRTIPLGNQLNQNLNQQIGVVLTIPILGGMQNHLNVKRARINYENAQMEVENTILQLRNTVYTAYTDLKAAFRNYVANSKSLEAQKEAFKYLEQRFNAGLIQSFEFNEAKNRLSNAEIQVIITKYEYLFRKSVVDFYSGKPLQW
jgi:outer membrane protein